MCMYNFYCVYVRVKCVCVCVCAQYMYIHTLLLDLIASNTHLYKIDCHSYVILLFLVLVINH